MACNKQPSMRMPHLLFVIAFLSCLCIWASTALSPEPAIMYIGSPYMNPAASPSGLEPSAAPDSLVPLLPSSPLYPFEPNGPVPQPTFGLCGLVPEALNGVAQKTAVDCMGPLAKFVGNVICCPQFGSMMRIVQGKLSSVSGSLALNDTGAQLCFGEAVSFMMELGANDTLSTLCSVKPENLTKGLCPVSTVTEFEQVVSKSNLLAACTSIDPLKECCKPVCSQAINTAAAQLASRTLSSLALNGSSTDHINPKVVDDCEAVVLSWLASQLGPESANSVFRNLYSCKVNKGCPLVFKDPSSVISSCGGSSPSNITCCMSLYSYISELQKQMLITNVQALNCVTLFGSMLIKKGVEIDLYGLCQVDLKDFSLQVHGEQGCLLRAIPSDVVDDKTTGISFTCDLNDNIAAPWPSSSSQSSFSLCASSDSLPALPVTDTSGLAGLRIAVAWKVTLLAGMLTFFV
ncbi:hypothetical protein L7F22_050771 [Adiantum nelumboides]|nr:hypothetical protein [Adiantum nelumboides]